MLVTGSVWALHFLSQLIMLPRYQLETLIHLIGIILSYGIIVDHFMGKMIYANWVVHFMAFAVLIVWIELMFMIGRVPRWGHYSLMFYYVLWNVIKVRTTSVKQIIIIIIIKYAAY